MTTLFHPWSLRHQMQSGRVCDNSVPFAAVDSGAVQSAPRHLTGSTPRRRALHRGASCATSASTCRVAHLLDMSDRMVPYEEAWRLQKSLVETVCQNAGQQKHAGSVILLQHPPVYTLGAGSTERHLRFDPADSPLPLYRTERGGEVTYHGPGQLVMYPILNLRLFQTDLHWYLRSLEEVIIRALEEVSGLQGERIEGLTGVWVGGAKVAAIGVRASRWVTYHGLALNVTTQLRPFDQIVPCGIGDRPVTSVWRLLGQEGSGGSGDGGGSLLEEQLLQEYRHGLLEAFEQVFGVELCDIALAAPASRGSLPG